MNGKQILDQNGDPIPSRQTARLRWHALSLRTRRLVVAITVFVVGLSTFLGSVDTVRSYFFPKETLDEAIDSEDLLVWLRDSISTWNSTEAVTDQELVVFLKRVDEQSTLLAEVWRQVHTEFATASLVKKDWEQIVRKSELLSEPNAGSFSSLSVFYFGMVECAGRHASLIDGHEDIIIFSNQLIEERGVALATYENLLSWDFPDKDKILERLDELDETVKVITALSTNISVQAITLKAHLERQMGE